MSVQGKRSGVRRLERCLRGTLKVLCAAHNVRNSGEQSSEPTVSALWKLKVLFNIRSSSASALREARSRLLQAVAASAKTTIYQIRL